MDDIAKLKRRSDLLARKERATHQRLLDLRDELDRLAHVLDHANTRSTRPRMMMAGNIVPLRFLRGSRR
jgi:hypothetical protein